MYIYVYIYVYMYIYVYVYVYIYIYIYMRALMDGLETSHSCRTHIWNKFVNQLSMLATVTEDTYHLFHVPHSYYAHSTK